MVEGRDWVSRVGEYVMALDAFWGGVRPGMVGKVVGHRVPMHSPGSATMEVDFGVVRLVFGAYPAGPTPPLSVVHGHG